LILVITPSVETVKNFILFRVFILTFFGEVEKLFEIPYEIFKQEITINFSLNTLRQLL
jgi:hypothetical protein